LEYSPKLTFKKKEKLDVDFKYKILGACNPTYAYKAIQQEDKIGTMLPCSVIVQELQNNEIEVAAVDPVASMMAIENHSLVGIASEIKEKSSGLLPLCNNNFEDLIY
jgi:uncharacterized protein (DUF302 family)